MKRYFTFFCVCLIFTLTGFLLFSRGSAETDSAPAETVTPPDGGVVVSGTDSVSVPGPEETGEIPGGPAEAPAASNEGSGLILASYREPELREGVLGFFRELTGSHDVAEVILCYADASGIPPALAFALCAEESAFNPRALNKNLNSTTDRGLFQLNSTSFPGLKTDDFYDPHVNARYGLAHLRFCLDNAGTEVAGLAMYNAGTVRVRAGGTPKKTLDYVSRILNRQREIESRFRSEYARLFPEPDEDEPDVEEPEEKAPFRLSLLAPLGR